ncbi:MAG: 50S ribosomal protein L13 [candidate division TM6 bacterium GW2011_GWE2_41_16]|nr:MAG: 50S ribosomal protein L13 [candidate division TM6 bacterium GW2011_GWE2_41_16]
MDMNRSFTPKQADFDPHWHVIDAEGKIVGRLATEIADKLRGKDHPEYTPHADAGHYVVVVNAEKVVFTGDKMEDKEYIWYTGWIGGQKSLSAKDMMKRHPDEILRHAVKGMLAKTKQSRAQLRRLKIYAGPEHPHKAQVAKVA